MGNTIGLPVFNFTVATPRATQTPSAGAPAPATPGAANPPADEPSLLARANRRGIETVLDYNDKVGKGVGGMLGLSVVLPAVYAGVIGGAVAGAAFGLGFGPATAVLNGAHGLSFLGTVFAAGGTAARIGTVVGTTTGLVGGFMVGNKVGQAVSAVPVAVVAYPIGFAKGLASKDDPYQDPNPAPAPAPEAPKKHARPGGIQKTAQSLLSGAGVITGGIGGAIIGAGVGSGVGLAQGLIASNLTLATVGTGGLVGAVVGGIALAGVAGYGGYAIATGASKAVNWAKDRFFPDKEKIALEQKRAAVAAKQEQFDKLGAQVQKDTADAQAWLADQEKALEQARTDANTYVDGKEAEVAAKTTEADAYVKAATDKLEARQGQVDAADQKIETAINGKADGILADIRKPTDKKYQDLQAGLDTTEGSLKSRDAVITANEKQQAELIESKVEAAYGDKMKPVQARYDKLNADQATRETQLSTWETQIADGNKAVDAQVVSDGQKDFKSREPALESTYRGKEADLRKDYQGRTAQADAQANQNLQNLSSKHASDMRDLDRRYSDMTDQAEAERAKLSGQANNLTIEVNSLQQQLYSAQSEERNAEDQLRSAESQRSSVLGQAQSERDAAVSERDRAASELSGVQSGISEAESERNNYINQKAQVDAQIPSLRAERDRLQNELNSKG